MTKTNIVIHWFYCGDWPVVSSKQTEGRSTTTLLAVVHLTFNGQKIVVAAQGPS